MSPWETLAPKMDAIVDATLGDTIYLSFDAGETFTEVEGYILFNVGGSGIEGFDETLGTKPRAKIAKSIIGETEPDRETVRLRSTKLGAFTYRPAGSEPDDQGRYWMFDIQRSDNGIPPTFDGGWSTFDSTEVTWDHL